MSRATSKPARLFEATKMIALAPNPVSERWHGIYPLHPEQPVFTTTIHDAVRIITGIGGKGMTTGPALARESIDAIAAH